MPPRRPSPQSLHLVRSRRLQRMCAWRPAHRSPAMSLCPRLPTAGDEPPPPLAGDELLSPRTASWIHVRRLLRRGCACATARQPPSPCLRPLHAGEHSPVSHGRSQLPWCRGCRGENDSAAKQAVYSTTACTSPCLFLIYFCSSCFILLVPHY